MTPKKTEYSLVNYGTTGVITTAEIRYHEDRNRLLRVLGKKGDLRPVMKRYKYPVQNGDAFLLCTDGFGEGITEMEIEVKLVKSESPSVWLKRMEKERPVSGPFLLYIY